MARRDIVPWVPLLLTVCGCLPGETGLTLVPPGTVATGRSPVSEQEITKSLKAGLANDPEARRIVSVGAKVLTANPKLGLQPIFLPVVVPHEEVFHQGLGAIYITEGLSKRCVTEGQLAAVLCMELGKMAEERERLEASAPKSSSPPPPDVAVGNDYRNGYGGPDLTRQMELYKYGPAKRPPGPQIKAQELAKTLLLKAGYDEKDIETVAPLLRDAEDHVTIEKSMTGKGTAQNVPWN